MEDTSLRSSGNQDIKPTLSREIDAQNGKISTAQTPPPVTSLFDKTSVESPASFINRSSSEAILWPYNTLSVRPALYLKQTIKMVRTPPVNHPPRFHRSETRV